MEKELAQLDLTVREKPVYINILFLELDVFLSLSQYCLCLGIRHHRVTEDIILFSAIYHMRVLTRFWDNL